ncbi:hypothetical protein [Rhodopseudomonas sp. B29]|uniref:hypothetical protein n=1 Tax=Rhodopseudomonas sp. B29 TaxID=95607 RepID=UPI000349A5A1|nr:hypothetical protein [Rhodopseudomonas sp. B29]
MPGIMIFLAVALGATAAFFFDARDQVFYGTRWAVQACDTSPLFCHHPEYLAYGAIGCMVFGISIALGRAIGS